MRFVFAPLLFFALLGPLGCGLWSDQAQARRILIRAQQEWREGNLETAAEDSRRARELAPELIDAYVIGSEIAFEAGDLETSIQELEMALQATRRNTTADQISVLLAERWTSRGRGGDAWELLENRAQSQPRLLPALADLLLRLGHRNESVDVSAEFRSLAPKSVQTEVFHASILAESGRVEEAVEVIRAEVGRSGPDSVLIWLSDLSQARPSPAIVQLLERLVKEPSLADQSRLLLAQTYMTTQRSSDADELITGALQETPESLSWRWLAAVRNLERGETDQGIATLNSILDEDPLHLQALEVLTSLREVSSVVSEEALLFRYEQALFSDPSPAVRDHILRRLEAISRKPSSDASASDYGPDPDTGF